MGFAVSSSLVYISAFQLCIQESCLSHNSTLWHLSLLCNYQAFACQWHQSSTVLLATVNTLQGSQVVEVFEKKHQNNVQYCFH